MITKQYNSSILFGKEQNSISVVLHLVKNKQYNNGIVCSEDQIVQESITVLLDLLKTK